MKSSGSVSRARAFAALGIVAILVALWLVARMPSDLDGASEEPARRSARAREDTRPSEGLADRESAETRRAAADIDGPPAVASAEPVDTPVPTTGLYVRAIGPDGEPVPNVALEWVHRTLLGGYGESSIRKATGPDGLAEIMDEAKHLEAYFAKDPRAAYVAAVGIRCAMPFEELARLEDAKLPGVTWIEERPAPGAIIDVTVPPYAFVRFTWPALEHPRGGGGAIEDLWFQVRRSDGDHFPGWRWGGPIDVGATEFVFGPVGLGWEVWGSLTARSVASRIGSATVQIDGERRATLLAPLEMHLASDELVAIVGCVVMPDGADPLRHRVWLSLGAPGEKAVQHSFLLGEGGAFELLLTRDAVPSVVTLRDSNVNARLEGSAAFPRVESGSGVVDVGDVELVSIAVPSAEPPPTIVLVAGRVLDMAGAPIESAAVVVYGNARRLGERVIDPRSQCILARVRTDGDGHFEAGAAVELVDGEVSFEVSKRGFQPRPTQKVTVGTTETETRLERGADVRFQLRAPLWALITERVSWSLRNSGVSAIGDRSTNGVDGTYPKVFSGVPDGTYAFEVSFGTSRWTLHREEVVVRGGDVDLGLIDLGDAFRVLPLTVLDAGGLPLTSGGVKLTARTGGVDESIHLGDANVFDDGFVTFIVPTGATELEIHHREAGRAFVPITALATPREDGVLPRTKVTLRP